MGRIPMNPSTALEKASQALFGEWCPKKLGEGLGVSERSVRRWRANPDDYPMPASIPDNLAAVLRARAKVSLGLADDLSSD